MKINAIVEGKRRRVNLGNLLALANSIQRVGLLHPVVVDEEGRLITGSRRLAAVKLLGWSEVPATVVQDLDATLRALAEHDENICRLDFAPGEALAMADALHPSRNEQRGNGRPTARPHWGGTLRAIYPKRYAVAPTLALLPQ